MLVFACLFANGQGMYLISESGRVDACSGTFYDEGGTGNYDDDSYSRLLCSGNSSYIVLDFTEFNIHSSDELIIYDGPNGSSPILAQGTGTELNGETLRSSANCLYVSFNSSGYSSVSAGWAATIACGALCQSFDVNFSDTDPDITNMDSMWIDVCMGTEIDFSVAGDYMNNNVNGYTQEDATTHFEWLISNGSEEEVFEGDGMTSLSHNFVESGGYYVRVNARDTNSCTNQNLLRLRVRVSLKPNFIDTDVDPDTVCINKPASLEGAGTVYPTSWSIEIPTEVAGVTFLPDGSGAAYSTSITHTIFGEGQELINGDDLIAVCANLEHSYMGDLDIKIICPNGQEAMLFEQACGGGFYGEAVDSDSDLTAGVGYDYCWSMGATETMADACPGSGNSLPSGDYLPIDDFDELVGCPLNGDWTIHVLDNLASDNGYIFSWQLLFAEDIIPDDLWTFNNNFPDENLVWSGNDITNQALGNGITVPQVSGDLDYTFTATDNFGCAYDTVISLHVLPMSDAACCQMPDANAGPDALVCGNSYTLSTMLSEVVNTVLWTQIDGPGTTDFQGNETSTNPTIVVSEQGVYTYVLYEENFAPTCSDTDTVKISFYQVPTSDFSVTFIPCYGNPTTVQYEGNATPAANYNWSFTGSPYTNTTVGPHDVVYPTAGTYEISLMVEENGCSSTTSTETVLNPPKLQIANFQKIDDPCNSSCQGEANITMIGGTAPLTYSWGPGPVNPDLCAGVYGVTIQDNNGCSTAHTYTITEPAPVVIANVITKDVKCFGQNNGSIELITTGGFGALSFNWSDGATGPVRHNIPAGMYGVTVSDQNGCFVTGEYIIEQPDLLLTTMTHDQAICEGETIEITLQAMGGVPPYKYFWSEDGLNFIESTSGSQTITPSESFTKYGYVMDANKCQTSLKASNVVVSKTMKMNLTTENNTCFGSCDGSAELFITGGIPPLDYSWSAEAAILPNLCAGFYDVTITDKLGCVADTSFQITEPAQIVIETYSEPTTCFGTEDGLAFAEATGGTGTLSFLWADGTINDTIHGGAETYFVSVTDANHCRAEGSVSITQPDKIELEILNNKPTICMTDTVDLLVTAIGGTTITGGDYDFYWELDGEIGYHGESPKFTPIENTVYVVYVQDLNGCLSDKVEVPVEVYPELKIENLVVSQDTICVGEKTVVELIPTGGNENYTIYNDGLQVMSPFTVSPEETTTFTVELDDACQTPNVSEEYTITVLPSPVVSFVSDIVSGCPPLFVSFNELGETDDNSYLWNFGDGGFAMRKNPSHEYTESGIYNVSVSVTSPYGCVGEHTVEQMISVFNSPVADYYTDVTTVNILDPDIHFQSACANADSTFWTFGDGDSSLVTNPHHTFHNVGEFDVKLIAKSENGCTDTIVKFYTVENQFTFFAPTAFTPNGDGHNDYFYVKGNCIDSNEFIMKVWDRWGELVFDTDTYDHTNQTGSGWDGTFYGNKVKGDKLLPTGIYTWMCKFKDISGVWHEYNGTVSLIR